MDIEQLKLILDTVKSTTGDAKLIGIAYIAAQSLSAVANPLCVLIALKLIISAAKTFVPYIGTSPADTALVKELRRRLLPNRAFGNITDYERTRIRQKVDDSTIEAG